MGWRLEIAHFHLKVIALLIGRVSKLRPFVAPLEDASICRAVLSKSGSLRTGTTWNFLEVLPLGLQAHLLALLPPQLPAPLEVHFLHDCDLQGKA